MLRTLGTGLAAMGLVLLSAGHLTLAYDQPGAPAQDDEAAAEEIETPEQAAAVDEELKPFAEQLMDFDKQKRIAALKEIARLGDKARFLSYEICDHLCSDTDADVRAAAQKTLKKISPKVVPLMVKLNEAQDPQEVLKLVKAIGALGPAGEPSGGLMDLVIHRWGSNAEHGETIVNAALETIEKTTPRNRYIQGHLGNTLTLGAYDSWRLNAIKAMIAIAKKHPRHQPDIVFYFQTALQDKRPAVRAAAVRGLAAVKADPKSLIADLQNLSEKDDDAEVRAAAKEALAQMQAAAE